MAPRWAPCTARSPRRAALLRSVTAPSSPAPGRLTPQGRSRPGSTKAALPTGLQNICAGLGPALPPGPAPPAPPSPPSPPKAAAFSLDVSTAAKGGTVTDELYGHDLEFTRHDLFTGLSAEIVANRKFAVSCIRRRLRKCARVCVRAVGWFAGGFVTSRSACEGQNTPVPAPCGQGRVEVTPLLLGRPPAPARAQVPTACDPEGSYACWPQAVQRELAAAKGFAPRWRRVGDAALDVRGTGRENARGASRMLVVQPIAAEQAQQAPPPPFPLFRCHTSAGALLGAPA